MMRGVLVLIGAMALAGCAVDEDALSRLRPGKTTVDQAIKALGNPDRDETLSDGQRMLTYVGSSARPKPANALPGLVYAWGGWNVRSDEAGLMFGRDGLLRFWSWSSNQRAPIRVVGNDMVPHVAPELDAAPQEPAGDSPAN